MSYAFSYPGLFSFETRSAQIQPERFQHADSSDIASRVEMELHAHEIIT